MRRVAAATLILSAVPLPVRAQGSRDKPSSPPITSGRVVADETSEPIVGEVTGQSVRVQQWPASAAAEALVHFGVPRPVAVLIQGNVRGTRL